MTPNESKKEMLTPEKARQHLVNKYGFHVTVETVRKWARVYKLGYRLPSAHSPGAAGRWVIDKTKLDELMSGRMQEDMS